MKSIRWKLLRAAFIIIATLSLTSIGFFLMHFVVVEQYKAISDNMVAEYRLMDATSNLISAYNTRFRNISLQDPQSEKNVRDVGIQIDTLTNFLDRKIINQDSKVSYIGLKNTIEAVQLEINAGLSVLATGNVSEASTHYDAANQKYGFVKENGEQLILNELKYTSEIQGQITTVYTLTAITGGFVLVLVIIGCIFYMFYFSKKMVDPIQELKDIAEQIAKGNMNIHISDQLLNENDEIGSLSRSYHIMIAKLVKNIDELDSANKKMVEASGKMVSTNEELERMNKFMVGRELRMKELKNTISQLTAKLEEHSIHD